MSLINSKNIFIGNDVIIEDSVLLNAEYGKGIYIEDNVTIKRFTTITSSGMISGGCKNRKRLSYWNTQCPHWACWIRHR